MKVIEKTLIFEKWLRKLRDKRAVSLINARIRRLSLGNAGDFKSVGDGVLEMRIDYATGYRVYYTEKGTEIVLLLAGGDKATQQKDIDKAKKLSKEAHNA